MAVDRVQVGARRCDEDVLIGGAAGVRRTIDEDANRDLALRVQTFGDAGDVVLLQLIADTRQLTDRLVDRINGTRAGP